MSETTDPTCPILKFHPNFAKLPAIPTGYVVLQANDDTCFYYSLPLLAQLSTFFQDLIELNLQSEIDKVTDDKDRTLIPLPSADSAGLAYVLNLVDSMVGGKDTKSADVKLVSDTLVIADAYLLPLIPIALARARALDCPDDMFGLFALFAVAGVEDRAVALSRQTVTLNIVDMPHWAKVVLESRASEYLLRLYALHARRPAALIKLKHDLQTANTDYLDVKHRGGNRPACEKYTVAGLSMKAYLDQFAPSLIQTVGDRWKDEWLKSRAIRAEEIPVKDLCQSCQSGALRCFRGVLSDLLPDLKPHI